MPEHSGIGEGSLNPNMCASCSSLADGMEDVVVHHQEEPPAAAVPDTPVVLPETLETETPPASENPDAAEVKHAV